MGKIVIIKDADFEENSIENSLLEEVKTFMAPIIRIDSEVIIKIIKTKTIAGFLEFFNSI